MNKKIDVKYYSTALPLVATFTDKKHKEFKKLHFRWIENAMSRCVFHGLFCKPGDVITISHAVSSTGGFYPGSRFPFYVKMSEGKAVGQIFEYDREQIQLLE